MQSACPAYSCALMLSPCSLPAAIPRRRLFRPKRLAELSRETRIPLGSLQEYDPADFARLVKAVIILNLREATASIAALMMSS